MFACLHAKVRVIECNYGERTLSNCRCRSSPKDSPKRIFRKFSEFPEFLVLFCRRFLFVFYPQNQNSIPDLFRPACKLDKIADLAKDQTFTSLTMVEFIDTGNSDADPSPPSPNDSLPSTVTILSIPSETSPDAGRVYLVGTAHFSPSSHQDVRTVIEKIQPSLVAVELCSSRVSFLTLDEQSLLHEAQSLTMQKIMAVLKQSGVVQGMLHFLLLNLSASLTRQLGMAPGGEFRAAYSSAREVPGCKFHLCDRPIEITLRRALSSLSAWQKLRLVFSFLFSREKITQAEVEKCKERDFLEETLKQLSGEFPALSRIFVDERDRYMCFILRRLIAEQVRQEVPNPSLVAVVGIGHAPGIAQYWNRTEEINIAELLRVPERSRMARMAGPFFKGLLIGGGCYMLYRIGRRFYH